MSSSILSLKNKVVTVTTAGTPVAAFAAANPTKIVWMKACAPAANTGSMYLGPSGSVSATTAQEILKGTTLTIDPPAGSQINVDNWKVDSGTNGDKLVLTWLEVSNG